MSGRYQLRSSRDGGFFPSSFISIVRSIQTRTTSHLTDTKRLAATRIPHNAPLSFYRGARNPRPNCGIIMPTSQNPCIRQSQVQLQHSKLWLAMFEPAGNKIRLSKAIRTVMTNLDNVCGTLLQDDGSSRVYSDIPGVVCFKNIRWSAAAPIKVALDCVLSTGTSILDQSNKETYPLFPIFVLSKWPDFG